MADVLSSIPGLGGYLAMQDRQRRNALGDLQGVMGLLSAVRQQQEAQRAAQMDPFRMEMMKAQVDEARNKAAQRQALDTLISQLPPEQQVFARIAPQQFAASQFREERPQVVAPGAAIVQGGRELYRNPTAEKDARPPFLKTLDALNLPDEQKQALIQDYIRKQTTHAPAPSASTTIINKQETEEAKAVGRALGQQFTEIQKSGFDAASKINRYDRLGQLLEGINTGKLTPTMTQIAAVADSLGLKVDPNLGAKQAAQALGNEIALTLRNPSGGAGMPGALSDRDREFLISMTPGLANTPEGNRLLIETAKKLAKRDQEVARMAREYRRKNGSFGPGFFEELQRFADANPLFSQAAPTATGGIPRISSDSEFSALPSGTVFIGPDGKRRRKP